MSNRFICTSTDPWTPDKGVPVMHPYAELVRGSGAPEGDYHCPICGADFTVDLSAFRSNQPKAS